eukprot:184226-Alexandrium_andersonii.AAC.1
MRISAAVGDFTANFAYLTEKVKAQGGSDELIEVRRAHGVAQGEDGQELLADAGHLAGRLLRLT